MFASSSDPVAQEKSKKALDASDPKILESKIGPNETHLYKIDDQHGNWLDCVNLEKDPISHVDMEHMARKVMVCLISHCMKNTSKTSLEFEN